MTTNDERVQAAKRMLQEHNEIYAQSNADCALRLQLISRGKAVDEHLIEAGHYGLAEPKRRWMQVSLRTVLVLVTLLCVALSMWVVPAERQRRTVAAIQAMGGFVDYVPFLALVQGFGVPDPRASEAFPVTFLRRWLPPDYFDDVLQVHLPNTRLTHARLVHLRRLTSLQTLGLDNTQGTNAGLAHLRG